MTPTRNDLTGDEHPTLHAVEVAARFVAAQTGGPARILTTHHREPDGHCAGCTTTPTRWPCTAAIATAARTISHPERSMC